MKISEKNKNQVLKELERLQRCMRDVFDDVAVSDEINLKTLQTISERTFGLVLYITEMEA